MRLKTEQFQIFLELQLIIPSFKMTQARVCKQRFKSHLLRNFLAPDGIYICNTIIQSSITRPIAAVLMT